MDNKHPPGGEPEKAHYTIAEAADFLNVEPETLRRWDSGGKLKVKRTPGGHRRYTREQLDSLLTAEEPTK